MMVRAAYPSMYPAVAYLPAEGMPAHQGQLVAGPGLPQHCPPNSGASRNPAHLPPPHGSLLHPYQSRNYHGRRRERVSLLKVK